MARIKYVLDTFDSRRAANGELCLMIANPPSGSTDPSSIYNINTDGTAVSAFKGTGICKFVQPNSYLITIDGKTFSFDGKGEPTSLNAKGYHLKMAAVDKTITRAGTASPTNTTTQTIIPPTRSGEPATVTEGYIDDVGTNPNVPVDSLQPRDQFAIQALRSLLANVPNSATLSKNEIAYYCDTAYKYAAYMMRAAADAIGSYDYEGDDSGDTRSTDTSTLSSNTEKLLNDIVNSLRRTDDVITSTTGTWKKTGQTDVPGTYTDEAAADLGDYADIAAAEADGWSWTADSYDYHEKISIGGNSLGTAEHPFVVSTGSSGEDTVKVKNAQTAGDNPEAIPFVIQGKETGDALNVTGGVEVKNPTNNGSEVPLIITGDGNNGNLDVDANVSGSINTTTEVKNTLDSNDDPIPLTINGSATVDIGSFGLGSSASNPLYVSGSGGSGGNGTVKIIDGSNNTLGVTGNPLVISGGGSGGGSFDSKIQNATGTTLEISSGTFFGNASVSGSFASVFANKMNDITNGGATSLADVVNAINNISGGGLKQSTTTSLDAPQYTSEYIEDIIFFSASHMSSTPGYDGPFRVAASKFATSLAERYYDARYGLTIDSSQRFPLTMTAGTYYRVGLDQQLPQQIVFTLPAVTGSETMPVLMMAYFQTSNAASTLTINTTSVQGLSQPISYRGGTISLSTSTRYEMDFVWNGVRWIIGATKLVGD